jgi:hypothetical protein
MIVSHQATVNIVVDPQKKRRMKRKRKSRI